MANTYRQLYIHIVFAVKYREALIDASWESQLHKYICGILMNKGHKPLAVNGMPDHIHIFIGLNPDLSISETVREVKKASTKWINSNGFISDLFAWQRGYGAFSHSHSQLDRVCKYVMNQKQHHARKSFRKEYLEWLEKFKISYDQRYLFDWLD